MRKMTETPRVLVVDDEPHLLEAISRLLSLSNYQVIEAPTAAEALRQARSQRPDVVLLDVVLPDMDGTEVCRQIKADPELIDTHVILFSGIMTDSDAHARGLAAGADGYLSRPISNRELLSRLEALTRTQRAEKALREAKQLYRATTESICEAIFVADDAGALIHVAGNVRGIFGYSIQEAYALGHLSCLFGRQICDPDQLQAIGDTHRSEQRIEDRRGQERALSIDAKRLSVRNGTILCICRESGSQRSARADTPQEPAQHLEQLVRDCMARLASAQELLERETAERVRLEKALREAKENAPPTAA
jgi:PAS domain S-box-containing protein